MALANYSDLLTAVANWLNRTDLTSRIPEFITLAEAEFNRKLRTIEMEATATATATDGVAALPSGFAGLRSITWDNTALDYIAPGELLEDDSTADRPRYYTIADGQILLRPIVTGDVTITYYASVPALTVSNTTNWLMTKHPDLYLFATLMQAEFYGWNDDRLPTVKARVNEIISQIEQSVSMERYGNRRLAKASRVAQVRNIRA